MNKAKPQVHEFIFKKISSQELNKPAMPSRQEKKPYFVRWSIKILDFKDRFHGLNYFQGFNDFIWPYHLHHGRRPTKQKALQAMVNGTELGTIFFRYNVG